MAGCQQDPSRAVRRERAALPAQGAVMSAATRKAYSYIRFSTPEQLKGDSLRRQTAMAADYCGRHGLTLDAELTMQDLGVSAYRGKNLDGTGKLGLFLDAVKAGDVAQGSVLLLEAL